MPDFWGRDDQVGRFVGIGVLAKGTAIAVLDDARVGPGIVERIEDEVVVCLALVGSEGGVVVLKSRVETEEGPFKNEWRWRLWCGGMKLCTGRANS